MDISYQTFLNLHHWYIVGLACFVVFSCLSVVKFFQYIRRIKGHFNQISTNKDAQIDMLQNQLERMVSDREQIENRHKEYIERLETKYLQGMDRKNAEIAELQRQYEELRHEDRLATQRYNTLITTLIDSADTKDAIKKLLVQSERDEG